MTEKASLSLLALVSDLPHILFFFQKKSTWIFRVWINFEFFFLLSSQKHFLKENFLECLLDKPCINHYRFLSPLFFFPKIYWEPLETSIAGQERKKKNQETVYNQSLPLFLLLLSSFSLKSFIKRHTLEQPWEHDYPCRISQFGCGSCFYFSFHYENVAPCLIFISPLHTKNS